MGFTLLEILVVISIIGILIAIGSAAFSTAQKKGRDARRRADMKQYQSAYEQYYSVNSAYSANCATMDINFSGGASAAPSDPKNSGSYVYTKTCTASTYCVCALLDNAGSGTYTDSGCTVGTGDYFCVQNLQ